MTRLLLTAVVVAALAALACAQPAGGGGQWVCVYRPQFAAGPLPRAWLVVSGQAELADGELVLSGEAGDAHLVLKNPRIPGSVRVEFDAVLTSEKPSDISTILSGSFDGLTTGYLAQFGSAGNTVNRVEKQGKVMDPSVTTAPLIQPGKKHHLVATNRAGEVTLTVDGQEATKFTDPAVLSGPMHNMIGFYTYGSKLRISNLSVSRLAGETQPASTQPATAPGRAASAPTSAPAQFDWPCWRGPNHDGTSAETGWNASWPPEGPERLWTAFISNYHSSPAVVGDRVYIMGSDPDDRLLCLDANTGKKLWSTPIQTKPCKNKYDTSSTPAVDGGVVYVKTATGIVDAIDAKTGKLIWTTDIRDLFGDIPIYHGAHSSPLVAGNVVVVNLGSAGVGLDKATGKVLWQSDKTAGWGDIDPTPVPCRYGGKDAVVLAVEGGPLVCVDPADGKVLWRQTPEKGFGLSDSDPIVWGEEVFVKGVFYRPADGAAKVVRTQKDAVCGLNMPVRWRDHIYGWKDSGDAYVRTGKPLYCLDCAGGRILWSNAEVFGGQMIVVDGKILMATGDGRFTIAQAAPEGYTQLATTQLVPEPQRYKGVLLSTPAFARGRFYAKFGFKLFCIDLAGAK